MSDSFDFKQAAASPEAVVIDAGAIMKLSPPNIDMGVTSAVHAERTEILYESVEISTDAADFMF